MTLSKSRNVGIDLLRIVCMLGVATLHILGHGNILGTTVSLGGFSVSWFWEIFAYPAVNCFVLISGFVGYRENKYYPKLKNLISLFFTVLFYSITICVCFKLVCPTAITRTDMLEALFPVTTKQYWFFSSYFALFLISPMLNMFVHKADSRMLLLSAVAIFIFSVPSLIMDPFGLSNGYSFIWFSLIYVLGAEIKKTDLANRMSPFKSMLLFVGGLSVTWLIKIIFHFTDVSILGHSFSTFENILISYCSPLMIAAAVGALCLFSRIKIGTGFTKLISFFAPMAFSVYLIHDNRYFRRLIISKAFSFVSDLNPILMFIVIPACALTVFLVCSFSDIVRIGIFKLFRIERLSDKTASLIKALAVKLYKKLVKSGDGSKPLKKS